MNVPQFQYDRLDWQDVLRIGWQYEQSERRYATGAVMKSGTAPAITEVLNITEDSMPTRRTGSKSVPGCR
ncbi:MAG: hypothetical protein ACLRS8_01755 [Parabacteroides merdae]